MHMHKRETRILTNNYAIPVVLERLCVRALGAYRPYRNVIYADFDSATGLILTNETIPLNRIP